MPTPQDTALFIGDSRIAQNAPSMPSHGYGTAQVYEYDAVNGWVDLSSGDTNFAPDVGKQWNLRTGRTFGAFVEGVGGSFLQDHWDPGGGHSSLDQALSRYAAAGSPALSFGLCYLGPNSIQTTESWTVADIVAAYGRLGDTINALNGSPLLYLDVFSEKDAVGAGYSGGFSSTQYRTQMNDYRTAVMNVVGTHSLRMGPNLTGELYADHTHPDTLAFATYFGRAVDLVLQGGRAPRLVSATINSAKRVIRLTVDQNLGNSIGSSFGGMRVLDDASVVDISGATFTVVSVRAMTITLVLAIVGVCKVSFASASDAVNATIPFSANYTAPDGATFTTPLEPFFDKSWRPSEIELVK